MLRKVFLYLQVFFLFFAICNQANAMIDVNPKNDTDFPDKERFIVPVGTVITIDFGDKNTSSKTVTVTRFDGIQETYTDVDRYLRVPIPSADPSGTYTIETTLNGTNTSFDILSERSIVKEHLPGALIKITWCDEHFSDRPEAGSDYISFAKNYAEARLSEIEIFWTTVLEKKFLKSEAEIPRLMNYYVFPAGETYHGPDEEVSYYIDGSVHLTIQTDPKEAFWSVFHENMHPVLEFLTGGVPTHIDESITTIAESWTKNPESYLISMNRYIENETFTKTRIPGDKGWDEDAHYKWPFIAWLCYSGQIQDFTDGQIIRNFLVDAPDIPMLEGTESLTGKFFFTDYTSRLGKMGSLSLNYIYEKFVEAMISGNWDKRFTSGKINGITFTPKIFSGSTLSHENYIPQFLAWNVQKFQFEETAQLKFKSDPNQRIIYKALIYDKNGELIYTKKIVPDKEGNATDFFRKGSSIVFYALGMNDKDPQNGAKYQMTFTKVSSPSLRSTRSSNVQEGVHAVKISPNGKYFIVAFKNRYYVGEKINGNWTITNGTSSDNISDAAIDNSGNYYLGMPEKELGGKIAFGDVSNLPDPTTQDKFFRYANFGASVDASSDENVRFVIASIPGQRPYTLCNPGVHCSSCYAEGCPDDDPILEYDQGMIWLYEDGKPLYKIFIDWVSEERFGRKVLSWKNSTYTDYYVFSRNHIYAIWPKDGKNYAGGYNYSRFFNFLKAEEEYDADLHGKYFLLGLPERNEVLLYSNLNLKLQSTLKAPDTESGGGFGKSVAISRKYLAISSNQKTYIYRVVYNYYIDKNNTLQKTEDWLYWFILNTTSEKIAISSEELILANDTDYQIFSLGNYPTKIKPLCGTSRQESSNAATFIVYLDNGDSDYEVTLNPDHTIISSAEVIEKRMDYFVVRVHFVDADIADHEIMTESLRIEVRNNRGNSHSISYSVTLFDPKFGDFDLTRDYCENGTDIHGRCLFPNGEGFQKGDLDLNGYIDLLDLLLALEIMAGRTVYFPPETTFLSDVNGDNKIGLEEAIYILKVLAFN